MNVERRSSKRKCSSNGSSVSKVLRDIGNRNVYSEKSIPSVVPLIKRPKTLKRNKIINEKVLKHAKIERNTCEPNQTSVAIPSNEPNVKKSSSVTKDREFEPKTMNDKLLDSDLNEMIPANLTCCSSASVKKVSRHKELFPIFVEEYDIRDPQCVAEYAEEIYFHMRNRESRYNVAQNYLPEKAAICRSKLVDWLVDVHMSFNCMPETLYLSIGLLDRFLHQMRTSVKRKDLQLIGLTALLLAAKYEEMYPPCMEDFVWVTDMSCSSQQIRSMERNILEALCFDLAMPLPINFLRIYSKIRHVSKKVHQLAKYAMELSMVNGKELHVFPSVLAAASLTYSLQVMEKINIKVAWNARMINVTGVNLHSLSETIHKLSSLVDDIITRKIAKKEEFSAVTRKYANRVYDQISTIISTVV